jgi:hypothetical protein
MAAECLARSVQSMSTSGSNVSTTIKRPKIRTGIKAGQIEPNHTHTRTKAR